MKTRRCLKWPTVIILAALWLLFPSDAKADGINVGFLAAAGIVVLIPLMAFEVFFEAVFLAIGLRIRYSKAVLPSLTANLASLFSGIPVNALNEWVYAEFVPHELAPYSREFPRAQFAGAVIYFVVTVLVELLVLNHWFRKRIATVSLRRLMVVVVAANAATYSFLAPLYYLATRPKSDIRDFTDDSAWANRPPMKIFYIDRDTGNLCSILTDGNGKEVLVPDTVEAFQIPRDEQWFLYRSRSNSLCLFRKNRTCQTCWRTGVQFAMEQVACSPDGTIVAYLERGMQPQRFELTFFDADSERAHKTGFGVWHESREPEPQIVWSNDPATLYFEQNGKVQALHIAKDFSVTPFPVRFREKDQMAVYGRSDNLTDWLGDVDGNDSYYHDACAKTEAMTYHSLASRLRVTTRDGSILFLGDAPQIMSLLLGRPFARERVFGDVCLLANGDELVFDDRRDIYLLNIDRRKIGWIAHGSRAVTMTARYKRNVYWVRD